VDALDALQPAFELNLVLANLDLHRCHDRLQPRFGVTVGVFEALAHLHRHLLEEALRELALFVRQQLEHGVDVVSHH
jgi:hypothetical protein